MANFHVHLSTYSRSTSVKRRGVLVSKKPVHAVAAAAYRAGIRARDTVTGKSWDFSKRKDVVDAVLIVPEGVAMPTPQTGFRNELRVKLFNLCEANERRINSATSRELLFVLPYELSAAGRYRASLGICQWVANRFKVAGDMCIHEPSLGNDPRNHHCHFLFTTREVSDGFIFGRKTRELDVPFNDATPGLFTEIRSMVATFINNELKGENIVNDNGPVRVSHLSLIDLGIDRPANAHAGPSATVMRRMEQEMVDRYVSSFLADEKQAEALALEAEAGGLPNDDQSALDIMDAAPETLDRKVPLRRCHPHGSPVPHWRKEYTRRDGTRISGTWVRPRNPAGSDTAGMMAHTVLSAGEKPETITPGTRSTAIAAIPPAQNLVVPVSASTMPSTKSEEKPPYKGYIRIINEGEHRDTGPKVGPETWTIIAAEQDARRVANQRKTNARIRQAADRLHIETGLKSDVIPVEEPTGVAYRLRPSETVKDEDLGRDIMIKKCRAADAQAKAKQLADEPLGTEERRRLVDIEQANANAPNIKPRRGLVKGKSPRLGTVASRKGLRLER